jgi:hypothetical protein
MTPSTGRGQCLQCDSDSLVQKRAELKIWSLEDELEKEIELTSD